MSGTIQIQASDGHRLDACLALPAGTPRGGLLVVQEAFGVNAYVRSVCETFAAEGYAALAPALYDRQQRGAAFDDESEASLAKARPLRAGLQWDKVLLDVAAAADTLARYGRVGIVGYCVGGSVAWLAAAALRLSAASCYYGRDIVGFLDRKPRCPTILHFGERDHFIPQDDVARIRAGCPDIPCYVYPAGHGFDAVRAPGDAEAARLARERTLELFRQHIG